MIESFVVGFVGGVVGAFTVVGLVGLVVKRRLANSPLGAMFG